MRKGRTGASRPALEGTPGGLAIAVVLTTVLVLSLGTHPALAAITKVQAGTYQLQQNVTSITPTLPAPSTSGTLLVAEVLTSANTTVSAPAGWIKATSIYTSGDGSAQIWYRPNNPGGISSVTFTLPTDIVIAQLSEWSGVAVSALDATGTATSAGAASLAVSATAAQSNELAITSFAVRNATGFTPASGWTNLLPAQSTSASGDYKIGVGPGSVSETETANGTFAWAAAIATFIGCGGGSLSFTSPATASFGSLTLNGYNQSLSTNYVLTVTDSTGSSAGWNLSGTSTTFTNGSSQTLPTTATTVTAGSASSLAGTCLLPTNSVGYPVTLPAAATAPAAVKLYNAAANTGLGPSTVTLAFGLAVPANAYAGTYSSTWTLTLASGP